MKRKFLVLLSRTQGLIEITPFFAELNENPYRLLPQLKSLFCKAFKITSVVQNYALPRFSWVNKERDLNGKKVILGKIQTDKSKGRKKFVPQI